MNAADLEHALHDLEGKTVWDMGVCLPTGADFLLKSGEQWRAPVRGAVGGYQEFGEVELYVNSCSWRLERDTQIVSSSAEIWATGDRWAEGLEELEGQTITSVEVGDGARDIALTFEDGRKLTILADATELEDPYNGPFYAFSTGKTTTFTVGGSKPIELKPRFSPAELEGLQRIE